jgi:transcriptional regulator GlxA family with amidase domain
MRFEVLVFAGLDELDALGPYEVLSHAAKRVPGTEVALVTADGEREVTGGHGITLGGLAPWSPERAGVLVVPGGGWVDGGRGVAELVAEGSFPERLKKIKAEAADDFVLTSVCSGAMLLAAAGLLAGRPVTTHQSAFEGVVKAGAELVPARVVDDGDIVTAAGVACGLDLGFHLVDRFLGAPVAHEVEVMMNYDRRGIVWRRAA